MKNDIQVMADDDDVIQVLNGRNCNMEKDKYLFYKLVNKIKSKEDFPRKVNKASQREWDEKEPNKKSKIKIPGYKPTHLEVALKRLVTNGNDQNAEYTNKKTNTNIDIYLDSIKGYEEELAAFDNAVEEAFVSCNRKSEINIVMRHKFLRHKLLWRKNCDKTQAVMKHVLW